MSLGGCLLLLAGAVAAGPAEEQKQGPAVLRLSGERVAEGHPAAALSEHFVLTLTVTGGQPPERPVELLATSAEMEVRPQPPRTVSQPAAGWQQQFDLYPRKTGTLKLEPAPLRLPGAEISWDPFTVQVTTEVSKPEPHEAKDVQPPIPVPPPPDWWGPVRWAGWAAGGAAVLAALAFVAARLVRRKRPERQPTPQEWAEAELDRVERLNLPEAGQANEFHVLLSDTVRRYLELRFQLAASRQTTAEFLAKMRADPQLTPPQQELLGEFLRRCDLVKFARVVPTPAECGEAAAMARQLVRETAARPDGSGAPGKGEAVRGSGGSVPKTEGG
jgi:hypothetical protein